MQFKIMVVDDSGLSRRTLRRILEPAGYAISEAADGLSAIEQYTLHKHDLVMLDMVMPLMDGLEVLTRLRQLDPDVRVITATADIQASTRELVLAAGAITIINKPFKAETVLTNVQAALSGGSHASE